MPNVIGYTARYQESRIVGTPTETNPYEVRLE
jgi:hypothetical protein